MFLQKLSLKNFRNYSNLDFKFDKKITVLVGDNAQGKTNFLESIYYLATTKSSRAEKEEELINDQTDFLNIAGELSNDTKLEIAIQKVETRLLKKAKVNGVSRRVSDYSQNLAVIIFAPEDINLVTGSPSLRRNHLDQVLSQVDKDYKKSLSKYEEVITKKNKLLKIIRETNASVDLLTFWLEQQLLYGEIIAQKRADFFNFINSTERTFGQFQYQYLPSLLTHDRLLEYQPREIDSASSLIGPHRDDFNFFLAQKDLSKYGSRGEQRTAVLDLKLSEINFIEQTLQDRPILLLDDIFSELDLSHKEHVLNLSKLQQTIITSVEIESQLVKELGSEVKVYQVAKGKIKT